MPNVSRPLSVWRRLTNLCFIGLSGLAAILVLAPLGAIFGYLGVQRDRRFELGLSDAYPAPGR